MAYEAYFTYDVASVGLVPLCVTNEASSKAKANDYLPRVRNFLCRELRYSNDPSICRITNNLVTACEQMVLIAFVI